MKLASLPVLLAAGLFLAAASPAPAAPRNVVVFFVDDMGWTDLGCFGSDLYETPHIDALAAQGVRFTQGYAACTVCSPSRAALLTGQYPARLHVTDFIPGHPFVNTPLAMPEWTKVLEQHHTTLAEILQAEGYRTIHAGKWHLAHRDRAGKDGRDTPDTENYPEHHGFDVNIGGNESGAPRSYFWPYGRGRTLEERKDNSIYRTLPEGGEEGEYLTGRLATEVIRELDATRAGEQPFFLHFSFYNVHTPLQARPDLLAKYEEKLKNEPDVRHAHPVYAAMVESVDEAVGRIMGKLEELGVAGETLVILTSDNGGLDPQATDNHPLRQGKGGIYEGGVRVPWIVSMPGAAAGAACQEPVITMDIVPTVLEALGVDVPGDLPLDGVSLLPLLADPGAALEREALYWHYPHYHSMGARPYSAIRMGEWKLIEHHGGRPVELYHLAEDIHEDENLATTETSKTALLLGRLHAWRQEVGAQMAKPNAAFDREEPTGIQFGRRFREQAPIRDEAK